MQCRWNRSAGATPCKILALPQFWFSSFLKTIFVHFQILFKVNITKAVLTVWCKFIVHVDCLAKFWSCPSFFLAFLKNICVHFQISEYQRRQCLYRFFGTRCKIRALPQFGQSFSSFSKRVIDKCKFHSAAFFGLKNFFWPDKVFDKAAVTEIKYFPGVPNNFGSTYLKRLLSAFECI